MEWFDLIWNKFLSKSNHDLIWKDFWFDLIWFEMIWNGIPNHVLFFMIDALLMLVFWNSIWYSRYLKNKIISNQIFDLICLHHCTVAEKKLDFLKKRFFFSSSLSLRVYFFRVYSFEFIEKLSSLSFRVYSFRVYPIPF